MSIAHYVSERAVQRFLRRFSMDYDCCNSCHEDEFEMGYHLAYLDLGKGRDSEVCCGVKKYFEEFIDNRKRTLKEEAQTEANEPRSGE